MPWFENRYGERLWYEEKGTGTPVLFLHGWCMSSSVWKYQFDGCAGVRMIAPDFRGHGRSRGVTGHLDFDGFTADLADLFEALDLSDVVLVGWSMGAQIALQAYAELSAKLAGMVLVAATPCFTASADFPHGLAASEAAGMRLKVQRNTRRALDGFLTRLFVEDELESHPLATEFRQLLEALPLPDTSAVLDALDTLARTDMRHIPATVAVPVLIMNGACDRICLPEASRYLKEQISHAEQTVFPGCGHMPFLTRSHQFNTEIIRFIRSANARNA